MSKILALTAPNTWQLIPSDSRALEPDEIRILTKLTGIRHGFDCAYAKTKVNKMIHYPWFPKSWGVGEVIEIGSQVKQFQVGDVVHGLMDHQDQCILKESLAFPRQWLRDEFTLFMEPTILAINAIRLSGIKLGDNAIVIGLGALGLLTTQTLTLCGVQKIIGIDPITQRQKLAQRLGATKVLRSIGQLDQLQTNELHAVTTVFDFSNTPIELKNVLYHLPSKLNYMVCPIFKNKITRNISHINDEQQIKMIEIDPDKREQSIESLALNLLASKKLIVWPIPCNFFPFEHAQEAFQRIEGQPEIYIKSALVYHKNQ